MSKITRNGELLYRRLWADHYLFLQETGEDNPDEVKATLSKVCRHAATWRRLAYELNQLDRIEPNLKVELLARRMAGALREAQTFVQAAVHDLPLAKGLPWGMEFDQPNRLIYLHKAFSEVVCVP